MNAHFPLYQVKIAGVVVTHTNHREEAHNMFNRSSTINRELWLISNNGSAKLLAKAH